MPERRLRAPTALLAALVLVPAAHAAEPIRVISDRTPGHLEPLFEQYEQGAGVEISAVFLDKGLVSRLESRPTEADLVITSAADILEIARQRGLLRPFESATIARTVDERFRGPDDHYLILSYRARAIYASRDRVESGEITTYEGLTDPRWRGRVCIRSGYHRYNVSLFAQMAADRGLDATREFLAGLHGNLARQPTGSDRAQVRGIHEGECDVAIANSYYMGIMLGREDQRDWGLSARVTFPNQRGGGAYVLSGGAALTRADRNVAAATALLAFLVSEYGQNFMVNTTYEYPVIEGIALPEVNRRLGAHQPGVEDGRFEANFIPLAEIDAMRPHVVRMLDEIDFDG